MSVLQKMDIGYIQRRLHTKQENLGLNIYILNIGIGLSCVATYTWPVYKFAVTLTLGDLYLS